MAQTGYWTEGKIVNGTNVGGGQFVQGTPPETKTTPTILSNVNKIEKTIPELNAKANDITGVNKVGTLQPVNKTAQESEADIFKRVYGQVDTTMQIDPAQKQLQDMMSANIDAQTQSALSSLQSAMASKQSALVESQKKSGKALENVLALGGSARYAPLSSQGLLDSKTRYDLSALQELQAQEERMKADILQAQRTGKFQLMEKQMAGFETLRKNKLDMAQKITDSIMAQNKAIKDEQMKVQGDISGILTVASKNGAPIDIQNAITNAPSLNEAVKAAGNWLQGAGGKLKLDTQIVNYGEGSALVDSDTGEVIKIYPGKPDSASVKADAEKLKESEQQRLQQLTVVPALNDKIAQIDQLIDSGDYKKVVGTFGTGRLPIFSALTGKAQNAIANIKQLISRETLDSLINLKAKGGTLGALSDQERLMLQNAATKLGNWEILDEKGIGTGRWNASESDFKKELEKIKTITKRAKDAAIGITKDNPLGLDIISTPKSSLSDPLNLGI